MTGMRRIIVIDDDTLLRETLKEQFSLHEEFVVSEAATATAGVAAVKAQPPDLVILDVNLPDMDGREACRILRRNGYRGPVIMLTGPAPAARKALAVAGLGVEDIDLFEINEAFAAVAMRFMRDLGISHEITNVNGGAIALGHPLGATGAMILGTLLDELERRDLRRGLATLCVGGGMGIATIVERV